MTDLETAVLEGRTRQSTARAAPKNIAGPTIPVASVEDLVLMKLVSERQKDLNDVRQLLRRFGAVLDRGYLAPKVEELADNLARPHIRSIFRGES